VAWMKTSTSRADLTIHQEHAITGLTKGSNQIAANYRCDAESRRIFSEYWPEKNLSYARRCDIMNRITTYKNASIAAYCVAALNIIPVVLTYILVYFLDSSSATSNIGAFGTQALYVLFILSSIASPILTLLVVRMLPCNQVARFCGYGAQVISLVAFVAYYTLASTSVPVINVLLLVGSVANLIWVASASWQAKGAVMIVGLLLVFLDVITSVISTGTFISFMVILINGVWFFLVARLLRKISNVPPLLDEVDAPADADDSTTEVTI
jgi:hypothetical protein